MTFYGLRDEVEITPISLHIASITPAQHHAPAVPFRRRAWRFIANLLGMAMCLSLIPAAVVLAMRLALTVVR